MSNPNSKQVDVLCGNMKLMRSFDILAGYADLVKNVGFLEQEGKTVVILAVDKVPSLIISLEEAHLAKQEAKSVVAYLKNVLKMKVCMITGDNQHSALKVAKHLEIATDDVTY